MKNKIDLKGMNKAEVLSKLYNCSKPLGLGILHFTPEDMTVDEATEILKDQTYFDYHNGRVMKIDLSGDDLDTWCYDRDNGKDAAKKALGIVC